jgi:hypothetical protein
MKTQGGTHEFSAGVILYLWVRIPLFAILVEKMEKMVSLLSVQWVHPLSSVSEEYKYLRLGSALG